MKWYINEGSLKVIRSSLTALNVICNCKGLPYQHGEFCVKREKLKNFCERTPYLLNSCGGLYENKPGICLFFQFSLSPCQQQLGYKHTDRQVAASAATAVERSHWNAL